MLRILTDPQLGRVALVCGSSLLSCFLSLSFLGSDSAAGLLVITRMPLSGCSRRGNLRLSVISFGERFGEGSEMPFTFR